MKGTGTGRDDDRDDGRRDRFLSANISIDIILHNHCIVSSRSFISACVVQYVDSHLQLS